MACRFEGVFRMKRHFSDRIRSFSSSPTLALDAHVKRLQAQGIPIINLSVGEPDFATPRHIQNAAVLSIRQGFTHYTPTAGIPELREAITKKLSRVNSLSYSPEDIIVGAGSKHLLFLAFNVLCKPGDEVMIPTPAWSTYVEQIKLAGGKPVFIELLPPFRLTGAVIEKRLSSRTRLLVLNSPNNPTGAMVGRAELRRIAKLAVAHNLWVISDEIYEKIVFGTQHVSIASLGREVRNRTITVNGFSKAYAMTGWRIGYAAGPREVIDAMIALQSQTTSCTSSVAQYAGLTALTSPQDCVRVIMKTIEHRRNATLTALQDIPGVTVTVPEGAFYLFIDVKKVLSPKISTTTMWCQKFLEEYCVAVVPGEAFFAPGYIRVSLTVSTKKLVEAIRRMKLFIEEHR